MLCFDKSSSRQKSRDKYSDHIMHMQRSGNRYRRKIAYRRKVHICRVALAEAAIIILNLQALKATQKLNYRHNNSKVNFKAIRFFLRHRNLKTKLVRKNWPKMTRSAWGKFQKNTTICRNSSWKENHTHITTSHSHDTFQALRSGHIPS